MRAFAAVRPPGHHAAKEACEGFCIFNNTAVAAQAARAKGANGPCVRVAHGVCGACASGLLERLAGSSLQSG